MDEKQNLKNNKKDYKTEIFLASFQTIFIFGIPAFIGAFIGVKLDKFYNTNSLINAIILSFTFVFSWVLVILKYHSLNKKIKEAEMFNSKNL